MNYNWNWRIFWEVSPDAAGTYLDTLLSGLLWTIATSMSAWIMALLLGAIVGTLRTVPHRWLVALANAWIELFRNIPLLVQMFLWYFVVPELLPTAAGDWIKGLPNSAFITAVLCLGFFTSSRIAVQVAAGIGSLPRGQRLAAQALGLTTLQTYRHVLLPMAFRIIIPPLTSEFLNIIKNSAVALTIGLMELTARARSMQEFSFQVFEAFTAATLIYVALNVVVVLLMNRLERNFAVPGYISRSNPGGGH
ncbi:amino acid ABC transporter permease [Lacisediminimonas profundi]|uniref:amino acid ABC transporter permease n=1 Tax=Lacisediminimonas profundi TaxID=2603856 RepID=UPI00124B38F9|nr:amino acid ABC transporter permease [Lacisediminimonas profundi]